MSVEKDYEIINKILSENKDSYYVDFVPITFQNADFAELADYLEKHYKKDFAKGIIFTAFTILYYYESVVYLDNDCDDPVYPDLIDDDLKELELDSLAELIQEVIMENWSGLTILFKNDGKYSLMQIKDGCDVYFGNLSGEALKIVDQLITQQGLYLKKFEREYRTDSFEEEGGWKIEPDNSPLSFHSESFWKLKDKNDKRVSLLDKEGKVLGK